MRETTLADRGLVGDLGSMQEKRVCVHSYTETEPVGLLKSAEERKTS